MTRAKKPATKKSARPRKAKSAPYAVPPGHVLALRVCAAGGVSWDGFCWPTKAGGYAEPKSWDPSPGCGFGLHGWLWGAGDIRAASKTMWLSPDSLWYVLEIAVADMVEVTESGGGKIKCRRCRVVFVGARDEAVKIISAHAPAGTAALFGTATAGDRGTATAGEGGSISIRWWDGDASRWRLRSGDVGAKEPLRPGVTYQLNAKGEFEAVK